MKFIFYSFLISILFYVNINSQVIKGKILNEDKDALPFSSIQVFQSNTNKLIESLLANDKGEFVIKVDGQSYYDLKISNVGYKIKSIENVFVKNDLVDLGNVILDYNQTELSEVLVTSKFGITKLSPGKVTYNTENLTSQKGGTGGDILKNMPSVFMGGSPNHNRDVRYRGLGNSYTQVLIDGRKSGITGNNRESVVDIIPAEKIDYIEILSNPTSEFSSDGINGLINIVTKKKNQNNLHGSFSAGVDNNEGYSGDISFYNSFQNFDFGIQAGRLKRLVDKPKDVNKINYKGTVFDGMQNQSEYEKKYFTNDLVKSNFKYYFSKNTYLNFETTFGKQLEDKSKNLNSISYKADNSFKENKKEDSKENKNNKFNEYFAEFHHSFNNEDGFKLSINYNPSRVRNNKSAAENKFDKNGNLISTNPTLKDESEKVNLNDLNALINYKFNIGGFGKIKLGYSYSSIERDAEKIKKEFDYKNQTWKLTTSGVDNFNLNEKTNAFFIDSKTNIGNLNLTFGFRIESTKLNSVSLLDNKTNSGNYLIFLPNINAIYNLDKTQYLTFAIGRRLRRPGFNDLNPFVDTSDPLKIKFGNPDLQPEKAWLYEIGYMKNFETFNAGVNIFYRNIKELIQKVTTTNQNGIFVETPQNFSKAYLAGIEFISAIKIFDWWQINGAYSYFDSKVLDTSFEGDAMKDQVKWTAKLITDINLWSSSNIQLIANYLGPEPSSTNYEDKIFFLDAGITQSIYDFGEISLRISDLFDSLRKIKNTKSGLTTSREVENTTGRIITLTTTWKF
ncbi:MAG: TonB-dependent receptor [Melioribacteraceae bacterium]|nr:TonB-dependent receptor [Melioribacteraceae bacterium]